MQLAWAVIVPIEPVPQSLLWPLRRRQRQRAQVSLDWPGLRAVLHGGRWVIFDATRLSDLDGLVRVARRRDAKDLALAMI